MWKHKVLVAAIVLASTGGCSAQAQKPEPELRTQSAHRTVPYLSDAQQLDLVKQVQGVLPGVPIDADRLSEAMRSTCVAMLDDVPNIDRVAASYLTAGLQSDLSELSVTELMHIAGAQEWCQN